MLSPGWRHSTAHRCDWAERQVIGVMPGRSHVPGLDIGHGVMGKARRRVSCAEIFVILRPRYAGGERGRSRSPLSKPEAVGLECNLGYTRRRRAVRGLTMYHRRKEE